MMHDGMRCASLSPCSTRSSPADSSSLQRQRKKNRPHWSVSSSRRISDSDSIFCSCVCSSASPLSRRSLSCSMALSFFVRFLSFFSTAPASDECAPTSAAPMAGFGAGAAGFSGAPGTLRPRRPPGPEVEDAEAAAPGGKYACLDDGGASLVSRRKRSDGVAPACRALGGRYVPAGRDAAACFLANRAAAASDGAGAAGSSLGNGGSDECGMSFCGRQHA